jgi:phosphate transport system substrate-binding protein
MEKTLRGVRLILLLSLLLSVFAVSAQDGSDDIFTISGSRIALEAVSHIAETAGQSIEANITGTTSGFRDFCATETPVLGAIRSISIEEEATCQSNEVNYSEYLIGYNIPVLIANPDLDFVLCLTPSHLQQLFAPSSQGIITDWAHVGLSTNANVPLNIFLPSTDSLNYQSLDDAVEGAGLRNDVEILASYAEIIEAVSQTEGALGLVSLGAVADADVKVLNIRNPSLDRCITPQDTTGAYSLRSAIYLYVNNDLVANDNAVLASLVTEEAQNALAEVGLSAPTEAEYTLNAQVLAGDTSGRQFSRDAVAFSIPTDVFGTISISSAASLATYVDTTTSIFASNYAGVTPQVSIDGQFAAFRRFCEGAVDIIAVNRDLTDAELATCAENNVSPITLELGGQAVVLVANINDDLPQCLTTQQVQTIWASQAEPPTTWADVDASFPATDLILVAPTTGSADYTDLLLSVEGGQPLPERANVAERNNDPAYRATAVGNVDGGLTYISWVDYELIAETAPDNIKLLAVDGGSGCIEPSSETIGSGEYPYSLGGKFIINHSSLNRTEVQSYIWYLFQDRNFSLFSLGGLTGLQFDSLSSIREGLEVTFSEAPAPVVETTLPETSFGPESPVDLFGGDDQSTDVDVEEEVTEEPSEEATEEATEVEETAEAGDEE